MKPYIYTKKNNIHIIDLQQTTKKLNEAVLVISQMAAEGKKFLFVGMRNKVKALIKDEAIRANAYYVNER